MKKTYLLLAGVLMLSLSASAQFHVELGINFNSPQGDFADIYDLGVGGYIEPKYAFSENIDLGLLIGSNGFAGADLDGPTNSSVGATSVLQVMPTGTYRFSENKVTPYAGLGLGLYFLQAVEIDGLEDESGGDTKFGFAPRAGVYLGRMNLGVAYNIVKDASFMQFNLGVRILSRD